MLPPRTDFPAGFTFGAATSAYQIEGTAGAGPSHWDTFAATPGNIMDDSDGSRACDHLRLWPQDLDLIRDAGFDGYRFSTSWARVMPDGVTVNPDGLDFYDKLVDGAAFRGPVHHDQRPHRGPRGIGRHPERAVVHRLAVAFPRPPRPRPA